MSLFICAFLGNTFYVASILTNPMLNKPPPIARAFFLESVPCVSYIRHKYPSISFSMIGFQIFIRLGWHANVRRNDRCSIIRLSRPKAGNRVDH
jgi:hypothetical protein